MKLQNVRQSLLISLAACFLVTGCTTKEPQEPIQDFDAWVDTLPTAMISNDSMNLEFLFEHPENYGFTPELLNLPLYDLEDYEEADKENEALLEKLKQFSYESLSKEQKMTYQILEDSLTRNADTAKFYYLSNSYLGSFVGFQAQLPLLLNEYTFESQQDLDSYFHILQTSPEVFQSYAEIEKDRLTHDSGMCKAILDKVIEQCEAFSQDKHPFLIDSINEKIDQAAFLDETQKQAAKEKNERLLKESFVTAYHDLGETLKELDAPLKEAGLAQQPNGKEYYEYLIHSTMGIDDSVEEVRMYLKEKMEELQQRMSAMMASDPDVYKRVTAGGDTIYSDLPSFEATIDYLGEQMKQDYPDVGTLNYDITIVPESMRDHFSPAAYLQGKIDAPKDAPEHIWVNGTYDQNLFETLAHEGYPGHMYQHTYFKQQILPTIRYFIDYNGYSEGWATYIERNSWKYAKVDETQKKVLQIMSYNSQYTQCIIALLDIAIHYDGIGYDEYVTQMKQYGFNVDAMGDNLKQQWYLILETPSNYLQYYLTGFRFQDLYDHAKEALNDQFDPVKLNDTLLKNGPAPFSILETEVNDYIQSTLKTK